MEKGSGVDDIKTELQEVYWEFIKKRADEYKNQQLTGRIVIDFQKGSVNSIFDQAVIAGISQAIFYSNKVVDEATKP